MSVRFVPVSWTPSKWVYDGVLIVAAGLYLFLFTFLATRFPDPDQDPQTIAIRAYGTCAFLLLSVVLAIGPLARLDHRFLPLLYNRRHFGVLVFAIAAAHFVAVVDWYYADGVLDPLVALLAFSDRGQNGAWPFVPLGLSAFLILAVMAATSHDFWLAFLGPPLWKALHMGVYAAYALIVAHVAFGALQDPRDGRLAAVLSVAALAVAALHVAAAWLGKSEDRASLRGPLVDSSSWLDVGEAMAVPPGGAVVVRPAGGEAIAVFNDGGAFSAVSHLCAHQNGPLGEGRIVDGCIVCPWHGYQYRLADGCAPAPFTEKIATYNLTAQGTRLRVDPRPNPPGTPVPPLRIAAPSSPARPPA